MKVFVLIVLLSLWGESAHSFQALLRGVAAGVAALGLNVESTPRNMGGSLLISETFGEQDLSRLKKGEQQVDFLLSNWKKKTVYCNFGEFKYELLDSGNKEQLMKEAAAGGILDYDKSATMIVKCRRDPSMVRSYVGLMDENPTLQNAAKVMGSNVALDRVQDDDIELYMQAVDSFSKALAEVDLLTYSARTDYGSTETQTLETINKAVDDQEAGIGKKDYIAQSRDSLVKLDKALKTINKALQL